MGEEPSTLGEEPNDGFMLLDSSELKLDGKGRIVLAAAQYHQIGGCAVIRRNRTLGCLELVPKLVFKNLLETLAADKSATGTMILAAVASSSKEVSIDTQRRLSIPPKFKSTCGIEDKVVVSGSFDRLYIWAPEAWNEFMSVTSEKVLNSDAAKKYGL